MKKTPDEIKKGLECCSVDDLHCGPGCPYKDDCLEEARYKGLESDALAYIKQLERERDAAVADIPRACGYCKWFEINRGGNMTECHNPNGCRNISGINTGWEWRGVKEE